MTRSLLGAAVLLPSFAFADANNFNYAEVQYLFNESGSFDMDGWAVNVSTELNDRVFANARFAALDLDDNPPFIRDIETEEFNLGLGYVFQQTDIYSLFVSAEYVRLDVDVSAGPGSFSDDEDGYRLGLGSRYNLTAQTELRAALNYTDLGSDDDFVPMIGLVHSFNAQFAGVVEYHHNDSNNNSLGFGLRFYY